MHKILLIVLTFSMLIRAYGKNCYDSELKKFHLEIQSFINQFRANTALNYSDSILNIICKKSQKNCDPYFLYANKRVEFEIDFSQILMNLESVFPLRKIFLLIGSMVGQLQGDVAKYNLSGAIYTLLFEEKKFC